MSIKASALTDWQTAIVTRMKATLALTSLISGIFDEVPQGELYPYIVLDDPFETPDRTFGQGGKEITHVIDIYTQDGSVTKSGVGSAGFKTGFAIAEQLLQALGIVPPFTSWVTVGNHDLIDCDVLSVHGFRETGDTTKAITRRVEVTITATLEDDTTF